jgi:hypothetical protein
MIATLGIITIVVYLLRFRGCSPAWVVRRRNTDIRGGYGYLSTLG